MDETTKNTISYDKTETAVISRANPDRKVYGATAGKIRVINQIPDDILNDKKLAAAIELLPRNYSFEIHKTVRVKIKTKKKYVPKCYLILSFRYGESARLGLRE